MQVNVTPQVEQAIQGALADETATELKILAIDYAHPTTLTAADARRIIDCARENPRFNSLTIGIFRIQNHVVLNVFRNGLPLCTSITTVRLYIVNLGNEGLEILQAAFYNTSVTSLTLTSNIIRGKRGGEAIRDLLVGNNSLAELMLVGSPIGPEGAIVLGQGLFAGNNRLRKLGLEDCKIGNDGLANLLPADGMINSSLTDLNLNYNHIEGAEGGRRSALLLQCFPSLKVLSLSFNPLGPLGAGALALGIAAASHLEELALYRCGLGNEGVANLIPDGQVNRSLTNLSFWGENIQSLVGGENVIALASRCTNLDSLDVDRGILSPDQRRRLDLLLDRKRLVTEASALAGSPFSVSFRFVEKAHRHEQGLGAILVILQNDGDDYFCTANNRAIEMCE